MNKVKGTYDVLPTESYKWQFLESTLRRILTLFQYKEMRTPIFEYKEVFHREDEFSDMVTKETYDFLDRSNRAITLRPEGTAGVIRAYVENKLYVQQSIEKLFYIGPNFRYERPQKGRYRQFYQLGVEAIGAKSPYLDAEVVALAFEMIQALGLKGVSVHINSIGDEASRVAYKQALIDYLTPHFEHLSEDSKTRLHKNPLRILDSKDPSDQLIIKDAPKPVDYLSEDSRAYYEAVKEALKAYQVTFIEKSTLVRGLDYYSDLVFEIEANIEGFGAQNVLGGGGRYEKLVQSLGGPDLGGVGFAFGLERLIYALEQEGIQMHEDHPDVFILALEDSVFPYAIQTAQDLRKHGFKVSINDEVKSFKSLLKQALRSTPTYLIFIGKSEYDDHTLTVKHVATEHQESVLSHDIIAYLGEEK